MSWRVNVKTLDALGLSSVVKASKLRAYIKMMGSDRGDFAISEFATLTVQLWARGAACIDRIKVGLMQNRVFSVSPNQPLSETLLPATSCASRRPAQRS